MIGTILLLVAVVFLAYKWWMQKVQGLPPGPTPLPFIGNLLEIDEKCPEKTFFKYSKKYGPVFTVWMGMVPNVFITDLETMKKVFVKQGELFTNRPTVFMFDIFTKGHGISFSNGELWREQRRFSLRVLRDFGFGRNVMETKILAEIYRLKEELDQHLGGNQIEYFLSLFSNADRLDKESVNVDLSVATERCVTNIITTVATGSPYTDKEFKRASRLFGENLELLQRRSSQMMTIYPWLRHLPFSEFQKTYKDLCQNRDDIIELVREKMDEVRQRFNPNEEATDYTTKYLQELEQLKRKGEGLGTFSEMQLEHTVMELYSAGEETTLTTLRWLFLFMILNPEIKKRCQKELDALLDERADKDIKMADKIKLPYTYATIQETQRLGAFSFCHAFTHYS